MEKEYLFLDERGNDVSKIAFIDIGDKIINPNGEWECVGVIAKVNTTIIQPTFWERIRGRQQEPQKIYKQTFLLKRIKKD